MARLLTFRERWAGSFQDVCSALVMLGFLGVAGFWCVVLS